MQAPYIYKCNNLIHRSIENLSAAEAAPQIPTFGNSILLLEPPFKKSWPRPYVVATV